MKKSKRSPSRIKYEKNHPTVSARLPLEVRDNLLLNLKKLNMSVTDAFMVLAGKIEIRAIPIEEAKKAGYEEAKNNYMISFLCHVCGKPIEITNPKTKEAAARYMADHGWGHSECHKQVKKS